MSKTIFNSPLLRTLLPAAVLFLSAGIVSCSDDDGDGDVHQATLYDVVEFTSQSGAGTVFTLWQPEATEPVTLTTAAPVINTSLVAAGDAVFLAYTPVDGDAYTSGPVTVHTYGTVNNGVLRKSEPKNLEGWDSEPVYLMSLWRAGGKICMRLRMTYDAAPRQFALIVDETTADEAYPTAYLYHRRPDGTPNFSRQYYAAFDVSALWATPGCRGLHICVSNSNMPQLNSFVVENPWPSDGVEGVSAQPARIASLENIPYFCN